MGTMIMPKTLLSLEELRARAFEAIHQYDGCEEVSDVTICEIADDSAPSNWRIGELAPVGPALRRELRFACRTSCNTISTC
jgi:hypothetical protein